jgi:tRNA G18 (ribose-2'-O)-methylase SpoU
MKRLTHEDLKQRRLSEKEAGAAERRFPFIAIIENVRSLYNVGSIFRTSDGARLEAIYTVGYTPHPPRAEIDKTALGATKTVPSEHFTTVEAAIEKCKTEGYHIASLEQTSQTRSVYELDKRDFPLALVIGNEVTGVSQEALDRSEFSLEIPMIGAKHSLNVAVAYGVAVFEAVRVFKEELDSFLPHEVPN